MDDEWTSIVDNGPGLVTYRVREVLKRLRRLQGKQIKRHILLQMKKFVAYEQKTMGLPCQWTQMRHLVPQYGYHATIRGNGLMIHQHPAGLGHEHVDGKNTRMITVTHDQLKKMPTQELVKIFTHSIKRPESEDAGIEKDASQSLSESIQTLSPHVPTTLPSSLSHSTPVRSQPQPHHHISNHHQNQNQNLQSSRTVPSSKSQQLDLRIRPENVTEIQSTCALLESNLRVFERGFDSDATESSSGGESCDELDEANYERHGRTVSCSSSNHQVESLLMPIRKRALRKWAYDRSAIAARWTWLQAQVADLDFRVRQQDEVTKRIRVSKGLVCFGPDNQSNPVITSSTEFHSMPRMLKASSNQPPTFITPQPPQNPTSTHAPQSHLQSSLDASKSSTESGSESNKEEITSCARTVPFKRHGFSKRRIVRSQNILRSADRKAAKYSSVHCTCSGLPDLVSPCVLCSGRYDYTLNMDTEYMPQLERVALLDSGAHHVLSFSDDISLGLHFSKMLKKESTQRLTSKPSPKKKRVIQLSNQKQAPLLNNSNRKSPAQAGASNVRRRYNDKKRTISESSWKAKKKARDRKDSDASSQDSRPGSPTASPASSEQNSHHSSAAHRRRRSEANAYDINNIVIPYSIAAATRVEKLQYKEIITPQWRVTESECCQNGSAVTPENEEVGDHEDISDQVFKERHDKCEVEEKRRIIQAVADANNRRGRSSRSRLDSERNTSVSNGEIPCFDTASQDSLVTPDIQTENSPATPATPNGPISELLDHPTPSKISDRRRTSSLSKRDENEDETPDVPPFEPRTFPLSDMAYQEMLSKCSHAQDMRELRPKQPLNSEILNNNENRGLPNNEPEVPEEAGNLGDDEMEEGGNSLDDPDWHPPQAAATEASK